jgi:methionyl-tRNA formyltransferase
MKRARILIFTDGEIGREIARCALDYDRQLICGLVSLPGATSSAELAREHAIPHIYHDVNRADETAERARALEPSIVLLAWWPLILKGQLLSLGQEVMLNLHPSLLPYARGKDPNFWVIVEGNPFGVSIHHVTENIDAGDIAFQREIAYTWEDTGETLYRKAAQAMVSLFRDSYPCIVNFDIPRHPQALSKVSFHRRRDLDATSLIDLDRQYPARTLLNLLRARTFEPHDACRFVDNGETYEVRIAIRRKRKPP